MQAGPPRNSCNRCRSKKLRCERHNGDAKCERCQRAGLDCVFGQSRRGRRPSVDTSASHIFIDDSPLSSTADRQKSKSRNLHMPASHLDRYTFLAEGGSEALARPSVNLTDSSARQPWPPTSPTYFASPPSSSQNSERSLGQNIDDFDVNSTSFSSESNAHHAQTSASLSSSAFTTSAVASADFSLADVRGLADEFFDSIGDSTHPNAGLSAVDTSQHLQAQTQYLNDAPNDIAQIYQWNLRNSTAPAKTPDERLDWTSQCLKELSDLDIELIKWTSQVASGQDNPLGVVTTDAWKPDAWSSGHAYNLERASIENPMPGEPSGTKCSLETTLGWTQRLLNTLKSMLRGCRREKVLRQGRFAARCNDRVSPLDAPGSAPIFDVPSLIHIMASYERLVRIYQTTVRLLLDIMRMKKQPSPSSSPCCAAPGPSRKYSKASQARSQASYNGKSQPCCHSQTKLNPPSPWLYSHLPKLVVGAFQPSDAELQLDTILHVAISLLQKVGGCVEELVRGETVMNTSLPKSPGGGSSHGRGSSCSSSSNNRRRGRPMLREPPLSSRIQDLQSTQSYEGSSSSDLVGGASSQSRSSNSDGNINRQEQRQRQHSVEDECMRDCNAEDSGQSAFGEDGQTSYHGECEDDFDDRDGDEAYDNDLDSNMSDSAQDLRHQNFAVEALLRRVRRLEAEVTTDFKSLQETVRSLPVQL